MYSPTHYYVRVSRAETFTGRSLASQAGALILRTCALPSWVELSEVLDVPGVLDRDSVQCLQAHGARPGDMGDPKRALPHGRKLVEPFPGEHPPQDEVPHLERPRADAAAVVPPQRLLVPRSSERSLAMSFLPQHKVLSP